MIPSLFTSSLLSLTRKGRYYIMIDEAIFLRYFIDVERSIRSEVKFFKPQVSVPLGKTVKVQFF